jgi:hypothetical protein
MTDDRSIVASLQRALGVELGTRRRGRRLTPGATGSDAR